MTNRNLGLLGAALLICGLFAPIASLPMIGSINLLAYGSLFGFAFLATAILGGALLLKDRVGDALWPGCAAIALFVYFIVRFEYVTQQMRDALQKQLADNPFAGLAQMAVSSVQLQWGCIPVAAGAGLLAYSGWKARRDENTGFRLTDPTDKLAAGASLLLVLAAAGADLTRSSWSGKNGLPATAGAQPSSGSAVDGVQATANAAEVATTAEEAAYIRDHLKLYDLTARYYDTYSGKEPGVNFKIKNDGNRTIKRLVVRVVFRDAKGQPIAEEEYTPVTDSEYAFDSAGPLRPNYIYQNDPEKFWTAKNVPTEWQAGNATASITEVEFGDGAGKS